MRWLTDLMFRLRALVAPSRMERELDEEMAFHVERERRKLVERGMSPESAALEARRRFGGAVRERERACEAWGIGVVRELQGDARHAVRQFRRHPAFAGIAVLTLALGIGATIALFSVVHGLLVRPLPFPDEDRLVVFWSDFNWRGVEFDFAAERVAVYDELAAYTTDAVPFRTDAGTSLLMNGTASAELFDVLGTGPLLGRTFAPGEDRPGAEPVVVVSYGLWQQELGGDPHILGRRIVLGGVPTTIIGVMPEGFYFPTPDFRAWRPLLLDPATSNYQGNGYLTLIGRVRSHITPAALEGDLRSLTAALGERFTYPEAWDKTKGARVTPIREYLLGDVRPALLLLLGAVGVLLLMACANAAALMLARTTDRTGEMAVRAALGAGRGRLAQQVLTESLVFALVAGVAGAALARTLFGLLVAMLPLEHGFGSALSLPWSVFGAALALAVVVAITVAAVPMRHLLRGGLDDLRGERSETGLARGTGRAHAMLVGSEVLLAVTLVAGAALLIRSVARLRAVELGLEPAGLVTIDLVASEAELRDVERRTFFREIERRAAALPGVRAAALINRLPIRDGGWQGPVWIESRPDLAETARPNSYWRMVTPSYFRTMGIDLLQGRGFDDHDRDGALPVTIVSESFARRMWQGESALGKRVTGGFTHDHEWITVVGVVADIRLVSIIGESPPVMYVPHVQAPFVGDGQVLVLRAAGDPGALITAVRRLVRELDPRVAVYRSGPMEAIVASAMAEPIRLRFFLILFAALGLLLGTVGVYGVVSYAVARRRAEFGIRMALGATSRDVLAEVVRRGMVPVAVGVIGGVALSLSLSRLVAGFLYEVAPTDPASLGGAAGVLLLTGITAAVVPAWRAGRVNPVEVLRVE